MPGEPADIAGLERHRAGLYEELSRVGDFRRGSQTAKTRRSGAHPRSGTGLPVHQTTRGEDSRPFATRLLQRPGHLRPPPPGSASSWTPKAAAAAQTTSASSASPATGSVDLEPRR